MTPTLQTVAAALSEREFRVTLCGDGPSGAKRRALRPALFNGAIEPSTLALVACENEAAVSAAVRAAADHGVSLAVLAGGHDPWARGFLDENLVLDVRPMSHVCFDPAAREVTLGGGAITRDLLTALPDDMVTVTGTIRSVGVTGLAVAGGYGRLTSRYGLAADCIRRARVVLADGSVVTASEEEDADLLWALRGGGSGFGVVTSVSLAVHPLARVLTAMIVWPLDHARDAMLQAQDLIDRHPVELSCFMGFMTLPTGDKVLFAAPLWSGDVATGETLLKALSGSRGASVVQQGCSSFAQTFSDETEAAWPKGRHYHLLTRTLRRLDPAAVDILVESAQCMPTPTSAIVLHDFHGAPADVRPDATAFALRDDHFVVEIIGGWEADRDGGSEVMWVERLDQDLGAIALPGGYTNFLRPTEVDRVRGFYGRAAARLSDIKRRVDPSDLFRYGTGRLVEDTRRSR